ncbi:hypothetical protein UPYG_G00001360 [Umbra pygmaea]|uniref:Uncharacterized protein n=1 Tax=Umbra pygmaea TaxID=75934 RepID=A0ABD0XXR4_UMBPY
MEVKRAKPLILRRDAVEGRMVARHIALETDMPRSTAANQVPEQHGRDRAGVEVSPKEVVIQLEDDLLTIGAELQMDTASSDGHGSLEVHGAGQGEETKAEDESPPGSWFEPLGEDEFDSDEKDLEWGKETRQVLRKVKVRCPVDGEEDWEACSSLGPGWKRKVVFRQFSALPARRKWDTYYSSPDGYRVRSKVELGKYFSNGVDLTHFDYASGLFLDKKNGPKHLNHMEDVASSSTSTSNTCTPVTDTPRSSTPDLDKNLTPKGTPETLNRASQNQVNFHLGTKSPKVTIHNIFPCSFKPSTLASGSLPPRLASLRSSNVAVVSTNKDVVDVQNLSPTQLPLSPNKYNISHLGLQGLTPTKNDLSQVGLQIPEHHRSDLSQVGLQIPEHHRKVVVVLRSQLDLDPITCSPPRHLALPSQWSNQWNGSNMVLNVHKQADSEKTAEERLVSSPKSDRLGSYARKIHLLMEANKKDALKKPAPSIVFRKLQQGLVSGPGIILPPCGEKRQRKEPLTDIEVEGDKWIVGGKQPEDIKEEEVDSSPTSLYNKQKKRKKYERKWAKITRRQSISRKVKMKEPVTEPEENKDQEEEKIEEKREEGEEEEEEEEEKPQKKTRSHQKVRAKEMDEEIKEEDEEWTSQKKKLRVKEKKDEAEWKPKKTEYTHSDGSESDEGIEQINSSSQAGKLKRSHCCGICEPCKRADCDKCVYCLDKPRNGGANKKKQKCKYRRCIYMPTKKDMRLSLHMKRKAEHIGQTVFIGPGPMGVPAGPEGFLVDAAASVVQGTVASEHRLLGQKLSKWRTIKSASGRGKGRGRGRGRPPKRLKWIQRPLSDTPVTDDTDEDEDPLYLRPPQPLEHLPGGTERDRVVWGELQERDNDPDMMEQIPPMSPSCMAVILSNGSSEEPNVIISDRPYPQTCYQGDHGNLKLIRINGHHITSVLPGPSLASSAPPVFYPTPESPSVTYLINYTTQLHPPLSSHQPPAGDCLPGYTEEEQLVELYAEVPRTILNLSAGSNRFMSIPEVEDVTPEDISPVIKESFSLALGPETGAEDEEEALFGFLEALRRTVLPAHWVGVMAQGPLLQLLQCSKLSTMADTILQIQPGFCYQVTVQGQPLLLTHPLYEAHPPCLSTVPQLVTLLLDLETKVVCPGFPIRPPAPGDTSKEPLEPVQCVRAAACNLLVHQDDERCEMCGDAVEEEELGGAAMEKEEPGGGGAVEEEEPGGGRVVGEEELGLVDALEFELEFREDEWV